MSNQPVKTEDRRPACTRRQFLQTAATASAGLIAIPSLGVPPQSGPEPVQPTISPAAWWLNAAEASSRVVDVRAPSVLIDKVVDVGTVRDMLAAGIRALVHMDSLPDAFREILGDAQRILVKFNHVGDDLLNTNAGVATALLELLSESGVSADRLTLAEAPRFVADQLNIRPLPEGYLEAITVAGREDQLRRYFTDADAVINVGLLKTHPLAGMSGCMKNISHAVVRHPARYHSDACAPYIAEIVGHASVSRRLRLNLVNAIRVVCRNGPGAQDEDVGDYGGILIGFDPVAVDAVGLSVLAEERRRNRIAGTIEAPFLAAAAERGLGRWRPADVERVAIEMPA